MPTPLDLLRRAANSVERRWRDVVRGETDQTYFDLYDLDRLNAAMEPPGLPAWRPGAAQASHGVGGAMRFVLTELATRDGLRRRFPQGLTERAALCEHLAGTPGLSEAGVANVRAAFAGTRGERVKRIYDMREDLREVFLFGLTPHPVRIDYLLWYAHHGVRQYGVTMEEVLWSLYEEAEAPDRGLVTTYLSNPTWQHDVPHALTIFGWADFKEYLRRNYGLAGRWFETARLTPRLRPWDELTITRRTLGWEPLPEAADAGGVRDWLRRQAKSAAPPSRWLRELERDCAAGLPHKPGVNVVGHFRYPSGLQEAARGVDVALRAAGGRTTLRELPVTHACDWSEPERYRGVELFDSTIFLAAVNTLPGEWVNRSGLHWRPGVKRVAYWYWELEELPAAWRADLQWPDEVWAPTTFLAETYRKAVGVPVVTMLPGVAVPRFTPRPRSHFGLPDDRFLFLFSFDMNSQMERKNPLAVIEAFRQAFRPGEAAHLALKVSRGSGNLQGLAKLHDAARGLNVTMIDEVYTRQDTLALLNTADCYASLHRSEGLGLGMAESMLLGKPVIATNYSGNLDFMTPDTAYLVDYRRVAIVEDLSPYPKGAYWADADVACAAAKMRAVFDNPEAARATGARAKVHAERLLSPADFGRRMMTRLAAVTPASPTG